MYDIWFYLFFWTIAFLLALPIVIMSLVPIIFQKSANTDDLISLEKIEALLLQIKKKEDFQDVLDKFLKNFKTLPVGVNLKHWLGVIEKIASSEYFNPKDSIDFTQELEDANEKIQKDIANIITTALKTRKKR